MRPSLLSLPINNPVPTAMADPPFTKGVELLCVGTELLMGNILNGNAR